MLLFVCFLDQPMSSGPSVPGNQPHGPPSSVSSNFNSPPQTTGGPSRKFHRHFFVCFFFFLISNYIKMSCVH